MPEALVETVEKVGYVCVQSPEDGEVGLNSATIVSASSTGQARF